ncbi:WXG100 family type VII secretion target [Actinacidiphila sp. bgisy167]|uniref:WXG100 family type VII secretion target n=1 Tax=Actinacidiphila sp. bgisy167 TaxID=3413797 RepID=UPI003D74E118
MGEFQVALQDLHAAIGIVRSESGTVSGLIGRIQSHFDAAQSFWQSPAASTFETTASWFTTSSRALEDLLNEMVGRLQTAYDNYVAAERANTNNLGG